MDSAKLSLSWRQIRDQTDRITLESTESPQFDTDGSKLNNKVSSGVYSMELGICKSFCLRNLCSAFEVELVVKYKTVNYFSSMVMS